MSKATRSTPPIVAPSNRKSTLVSAIISFICFLVTLWVGDRCLGYVLQSLFNKQKSGEDWNTTVVLKESIADIEIFGDSRCAHHYNPLVFEEVLAKSATCNNSGRAAQSILYSEVALTARLDRQRPKAILLDLSPIVTLHLANAKDRLSVYLPYYDDVPAVRSVIESRSHGESLKLKSHCYRFNSKVPTLLKGLKETQLSQLKGYRPLSGRRPGHRLSEPPIPLSETEIQSLLDPEFEASLIAFVRKANEAGIPVVLIASPFYNLSYERLSEKCALEKLAGLQFEYWDYLGDPRFLGQESKFHDRSHLNADGANEFSRIVAERLASLLQ